MASGSTTTASTGNSNAEQAEFIERTNCIACGSCALKTLDKGTFGREPHRSMIAEGIWGTNPLPYINDCEWELVECAECGQIFHKRILTPQWDERRHTEWMNRDAIERFEELHGSRTPNALFEQARADVDRILCLEKMTRRLRKGEMLRLLDFGCGWGRLVTLGNIFGFAAHGVDRSNARRSGQQGGLGTIFASLDEYITHEPRPVHVVCLLQVLEHVTAPMEILNALHKVMIPGGILLLEVPDASGLSAINTADDLVADGLDHLNAFTPKTLLSLAVRAGFSPVTKETAHVTADLGKVAKREVRRLLGPVLPRTTAQFFSRD
jgi:2-polyprenyl-3-methyl-5-hydroxy-6-metoxy-1,4-benzoquinol methylase